MNIKKLTFLRYCLRTTVIGTPVGVLTGYIMFMLGQPLLAVVSAGSIGLLAGVLISLANYKKFIAPMKRAMTDMEDIAHRSGTALKGQMNSIADLEETFLKIIKELSEQLEEAAKKLTGSVADLKNCAGQTSIGAAETADAIGQVAASTVEISGKLDDINRQADQVAGSLTGGGHDLQVISDHVRIIARQNSLSVEVIKKLNQHSEAIKKSLETIEGIAQRINLLSLNASIEAAKSGESERDFLVVAGEVRKLADQSAKVVREIGVLVNSVEESSRQAWGVVSEEQLIINDETEKISALQNNMSSSLAIIEDFLRSVREIPDMVGNITGSVQNIAAVAQQTGASAGKMDNTLNGVAGMVSDLNDMSAKFKIDVEEKDKSGRKKFQTMGGYVFQTAAISFPVFGAVGYLSMAAGRVGTANASMWPCLLTSAVLTGVCGFLISAGKYRQMVGPMKKVMHHLERVALQSGSQSARSLKTVADLENSFRGIIGDLVRQLGIAGDRLGETLAHLRECSEQTLAGAEETAGSITEVAASAQRICAQVDSINENIDSVAGFLAEGSQNLQVASDQVQAIARQSKLSVEIIDKLNQEAEEIVKSLEMIKGIAQRTNLLSLNAAVKAIKAGDAGRGFAIVAEEVGSLADQSSRAAREIAEIVNDIADSSRQAVSLIKEEYDIVREETEKITLLKSDMTRNLGHISGFLQNVREIPQVVGQIAEGVHNVAAVAQENSATTQEVSTIVHDVEQLAGRLNHLAAKFSITE
jgi:methyl-accepting chemotaxis protein